MFQVEGWSDLKVRRFPDGFLFGAGTSAYQVEGAWNEDGKGESIWDKYLHDNPDIISDGRNGDVASNSYHQYKRDVEMLRELGVDYYRFSISWSRVLPRGFSNEINEKGLEYYDKLIDELLKYNIKPMITLYHFDLPQTLQDFGGWANPLSTEWFEDYAAVIFKAFAHKVPYWITVNQPNSICVEGYGQGLMAPAISSSGIGDYMCIKNVLVAHARAYRLYEREYKKKFKGSVGIALALNWADPVNNSTKNVEATDVYREFMIGLYMHPIWSKDGGFPKMVKERVHQNSIKQGFKKSRLPALSKEEVTLLKGSSDFVGVNHYTTVLVKSTDRGMSAPSFDDDVHVELTYRPEWKNATSSWLKSVPYGIYRVCVYLNTKYDYPQMFVTEHGWSTRPGLKDDTRVENLRLYLKAILFAIEDGTDLKGYTTWSLMDNVEWVAGTSERFGLYEVDFESEDKNRTARLSALVYKRIIDKRIVEDDYKPNNLKMSITNRNVKTEL
ncbi:seminal fluid protein CSSFP020 [Danaus plexippus plexippus]|uniref:Cytosolic beta-glucosidase n=1 Tax=Danaus plexippus plexippus TaxID=278856 RepID=A0A212F3C5_DANPL|nr:seminal fluid protein CSSFP020 [Danaus plexippus plexippus]